VCSHLAPAGLPVASGSAAIEQGTKSRTRRLALGQHQRGVGPLVDPAEPVRRVAHGRIADARSRLREAVAADDGERSAVVAASPLAWGARGAVEQFRLRRLRLGQAERVALGGDHRVGLAEGLIAIGPVLGRAAQFFA
jgi:hypothetical protein